MERYEIWIAEVPFEDLPETTKHRPVLILDPSRREVVVLRMTSQSPKTAQDFQLTEYVRAGLSKPTVINTSHRIKLPNSSFLKQIGILHPNDICLLKVKYHIT